MDNIFILFKNIAINNKDIAIETSSEQIQYQDLLTLSLCYIQYLSTIKQNRIAIKCEKISIHSIAMMLAIFANKKSCLLIDKRRPSLLNEKILKMLQCEVVFKEWDLENILKNNKNSAQTKTIDEVKVEAITEQDEGYIVTTSGSTGEAKIILGRHIGLAHFIQWQKKRYFQNKKRVAQLTNCAFDVIYREILTTLISGSTLVIPDEDLKYQSGVIFRQWIEQHQIDTVYMVPSICDFWMSTLSQQFNQYRFENVFFAGEKLQKSTILQMMPYFEIDKITNLYGPSETTLAKFYYDFDFLNIDKFQEIPVGQPLPDTEYTIGENEQIFIYSKFSSLGYLDKETFIYQNGKNWYPTGDAGVIKNEMLFVNGRLDDQVKINGVRVHLNHINAQIKSVSGVLESIVLLDLQNRLVAFYTGMIEKSALYKALKDKLYQQIMPSHLYHLEEMPRTASAKIDRKFLLQSLVENQQSNIIEDDIIYHSWRKVTGYADKISEEDNFFELGGDSLDVTGFVIELEERTGKKINYWSVYEHPIIKDFRQWLNNQELTGEIVETTQNTVQRHSSLSSYPLSPQQVRYKKIYMPVINGNWCNMLAIWDFGLISKNQLQVALEQLLARHDALRSYYKNGSMRVMAQTQCHYSIQYFVVDEADFDKTLEQIRLTEAEKVIDIEKWPLFSMTFLSSASKQCVIWNIHHLICDGFSQTIIYSELKNLMNNHVLSFQPMQYSVYAMNQQKGATQKSLKYWQKVYQQPYKKINIPVQDERFGARGYETRIGLSHTLSQQIKKFAQLNHCTPFTIILASYFLCLHEQYQAQDIVVGTPALGRQSQEEEKIIGNFISLVTIRSNWSVFLENNLFKYLEGIHKGIYQAIKYQDFQYHDLLDLQGYDLEQDRFPLTTFFISMVDKKELDLEQENSFMHQDMGCNVKFDKMLYVDVYKNQFLLRLQYRRALFTFSQQQDFLDKLIEKIKQIIGESVCG